MNRWTTPTDIVMFMKPVVPQFWPGPQSSYAMLIVLAEAVMRHSLENRMISDMFALMMFDTLGGITSIYFHKVK